MEVMKQDIRDVCHVSAKQVLHIFVVLCVLGVWVWGLEIATRTRRRSRGQAGQPSQMLQIQVQNPQICFKILTAVKNRKKTSNVNRTSMKRSVTNHVSSRLSMSCAASAFQMV